MSTNNRLDFSKRIKDQLAKRVGYHCSNPNCGIGTVGPSSQDDESTSIGVAAHIYPAAPSPKGPRYNPDIDPSEIKKISNGIWLCNNCSTEIDRDPNKYPPELLKKWKKEAEEKASLAFSSKTKRSQIPIAYDGYLFENRLEATWAAFFKELNWTYEYKPFDFGEWKPKFKIVTEAPSNNQFYADVLLSKEFDKNKRIEIGKATNYAGNILILSDNPFSEDEASESYPNRIGFLSIEGKPEDGDFEFRVSAVFDFYGEGYNIHDLGMLKSEEYDLLEKGSNFCRGIWKKCKNSIK